MLYADLRDADLARKLAVLTPVPGYCICVDIVGSTGLKGAGPDVWVTTTLEAFACVRSCLYAKFPPIKSLGDALMFFIPADAMEGETAASLVAACCDMAVERRIAAETRIAGVLCEEAYPITFMPGRPDYHGSDIDVAFRLLELAGPREVVIDRRFYEAACQAGGAPLTQSFRGPWPVTIRGLSSRRDIYKYVSDFA
jgi:class 3 adenylate cyclase